jgi:hypothetical protein
VRLPTSPSDFRLRFFISRLRPNRAVVRFCNTRGTAEQWIKEGKRWRLVKHPRYFWLLLTESDLTRRLFGMPRRI